MPRQSEHNTQHSNKDQRVIVDLAQPIKLPSDLTLDYSTQFIIRGNSIEGTIIVGPETTVDVMSPEKADFVIQATPDVEQGENTYNYIMQAGKVVTGAQVKSLTIKLTKDPSLGKQYRANIYYGDLIQATIENKLIKTNQYNYIFQTYYDGTKMSLTCIAVNQLCIFAWGATSDEEGVINIGSIAEISSIGCTKETIRVYIGAQQYFYIADLPPQPYNYEFIPTDTFQFYYHPEQMSKLKSLYVYKPQSDIPSTYTISLNDQSDLYNSKVFEFTSAYFDNFDVEEAKKTGVVIPEPGLKGNAEAIEIFQNPSKYVVRHEKDFPNNPILEFEGKYSGYTNVFVYTKGESKEPYQPYVMYQKVSGLDGDHFYHLKPEDGTASNVQCF